MLQELDGLYLAEDDTGSRCGKRSRSMRRSALREAEGREYCEVLPQRST